MQRRVFTAVLLVGSSIALAACGSHGSTYVPGGGVGGGTAAGGTPNTGGASSGGANSGGVNATGGATGGTGASVGGTAGASGSDAGGGNAGTPGGGTGGGGSSGAGGADSVLFTDDFEDDDETGWVESYDSFDIVFVGDSYIYRANTGPTDDTWTMTGDSSWTDMKIDVDAIVKDSGSGASTHVGIAGRVQDFNNYYRLEYHEGNVALTKAVNGSVTSLDASQTSIIPKEVAFTMTLVIQGSSISGYVNDVMRVSAIDTSLTSGQMALTAMDGFVDFDNVSVTLPPAATF